VVEFAEAAVKGGPEISEVSKSGPARNAGAVM